MERYIARLKEIGSECSVLYVEDEENIRSEMRILLSKFFARVECVSNGLEGLESYKNGDFDIVVTDIEMPKMSGIEMAQEIKNLNRDQIIVIITAFTNDEYFKKALSIGINSFILKPAKNEQLLSALYDAAVRTFESKTNREYRNSLEKLVQQRTGELVRAYTTDELTGLPNYQALKEALSKEGQKSFVLLNADNFEMINNAYGIEGGDRALKQIADLLKVFVSQEISLFRVHGDEFAFVLQNKSADVAYELAVEIRAYFSQNKLLMEGDSTEISLTIGIDANGGIDMLAHAKLAIKEVRLLGKDRIARYEPDSPLLERQKETRVWINRSREAIKKELFVPYFQPIYDNKSGSVYKYECLARMVYEGEVISPAKFIEPARISGLLPGITRQMVDKSFAYFQNRDSNFSINIGNYDIKEGYLKEFLIDKLERYRIDPNRVTLEILESISSQDARESLSQLMAIKELGFKLAIDDFGTDSSNFSRLLDMNVEYIKIDGSFIKMLDSDESSRKITSSIVAFARSVGAEVIAEFVHSRGVLDAVKSMDIEYSQGFYLGEPKPSV